MKTELQSEMTWDAQSLPFHSKQEGYSSGGNEQIGNQLLSAANFFKAAEKEHVYGIHR